MLSVCWFFGFLYLIIMLFSARYGNKLFFVDANKAIFNKLKWSRLKFSRCLYVPIYYEQKTSFTQHKIYIVFQDDKYFRSLPWLFSLQTIRCLFVTSIANSSRIDGWIRKTMDFHILKMMSCANSDYQTIRNDSRKWGKNESFEAKWHIEK